jgi:hypothetical protein
VVRKFSALSCLMVKVDKHYVNDKSAAKQSAAVNMLFNQGVIDPGLHPRDWWEMLDRNHIRMRVFRSRGITLSESIEGHCLNISWFPSDDFLSKRTKTVPNTHKLVSYANV